MTPTVEIEIPSGAGYVAVVRLALASLARKEGMDEERVDDLKIAISEACTNAVEANDAAGSGGGIGIRWSAAQGVVTVEVEDHAGTPESVSLEDSQGFSTRQAMSHALLQSLVTSLETEPGPHGTITRLTLAP